MDDLISQCREALKDTTRTLIEDHVSDGVTAKVHELHGIRGFPQALWRVSNDANVELPVRQSAARHFRIVARCTWRWRRAKGQLWEHLWWSKADKSFVRSSFLEAVVAAPLEIQREHNESLKWMFFPQKARNDWPELGVQMLDRLQVTPSPEAVPTLVPVLRSLTRICRFMSGGDLARYEKCLSQFAPIYGALLNMGQKARSWDAQDLRASNELLHFIFKVYFHTVSHRLPDILMEEDTLKGWLDLLLGCLKDPIPSELASVPMEGNDERCEAQSHPCWKARKWALRCLQRFLRRLGNPCAIHEKTTAAASLFARKFIKHHTPIILKVHLEVFEEWLVSKKYQVFVNTRVQHELLRNLAEGIQFKGTWPLIRDKLGLILNEFAFRSFSFNAHRAEPSVEDPVDYMNRRLTREPCKSPGYAAEEFMRIACRYRKKWVFVPLLELVETVSKQYQAGTGASRDKFSAFRLMSALKPLILREIGTDAKLLPRIREYFIHHVFPQLEIDDAPLRMVAYQLTISYARILLERGDECRTVVAHAIEDLRHENLLVGYAAAEFLNRLLEFHVSFSEFTPKIPQIMADLLHLGSKIPDTWPIGATVEELVRACSPDCEPLAVGAAEQLAGFFIRELDECITAGMDLHFNREAFNISNHKENTARFLLTAVKSLTQVVAQRKDTLQKIVPFCHVILESILSRRYDQLIGSALELMSDLVRYQESVSKEIWDLHQVVIKWITSHPEMTEFAYRAVESVLLYGEDFFRAQPEVLQRTLNAASRAWGWETNGDVQEEKPRRRSVAFRILEATVLRYREDSETYIPQFLDSVLQRVFKDGDDEQGEDDELKANMMQLVSACLIANSQATLQYLDRENATERVLKTWFSVLPNFNQIHGRKIVVLGLSILLRSPPRNQEWGKVLNACLTVLEGYSDAVERRDEERRLLSVRRVEADQGERDPFGVNTDAAVVDPTKEKIPLRFTGSGLEEELSGGPVPDEDEWDEDRPHPVVQRTTERFRTQRTPLGGSIGSSASIETPIGDYSYPSETSDGFFRTYSTDSVDNSSGSVHSIDLSFASCSDEGDHSENPYAIGPFEEVDLIGHFKDVVQGLERQVLDQYLVHVEGRERKLLDQIMEGAAEV